MELVTFKMDIHKQAAPVRKKIEKLQWQIDNAVLREDQIKDKRSNRAIKETDQSIGRPIDSTTGDQSHPQDTPLRQV